MIKYAFNSWLNGYKKICCYYGRERRSAFGCFLLIQFIVFIIFGVVSSRLTQVIPGFSGQINDFIAMVFCFVSFLTILSYNIRRLHDANLSGWICLLYLGFATIVIIVSICIPSTVGMNKYGADPRVKIKEDNKDKVNLIVN